MSGYALDIQVSGGDITSARSHLTADSVEYVTAAFSFDESWKDLLKTAVFRVGELVYHVPLEENLCKIPFEALKEPIMYISVFGVLGATRATTAELPILVQNSGYVACEPSEATPDPYNYFLERVTELREETAADLALSRQAADNTAAASESAAAILGEIESIAGEVEADCKEVQNAVQTVSTDKGIAMGAAEVASAKANEASLSVTEAKEAAQSAQTAVMGEIEAHNKKTNALAHPNITELAEQAKSIALGKANSLCFETEEQLKQWVEGGFQRSDGKTTGDLKVGDNLYILELGVPDYWWDGTYIQPLGAEKPDLSDYYTKEQIDNRIKELSFDLVSRSEYDSAYLDGSLDAGRIYFVYEEE